MILDRINPKDDIVEPTIQAVAQAEWHSYKRASVNTENVALSDLSSLIDTVHSDRYQNSRSLLDMYILSKIDIYDSASIHENHSRVTLIPPIVERSEHGLLIIDGVHRCLAAHLRGYKYLNAAVISTPSALPPYVSREIDLVNVQVSDELKEPMFTKRFASDPLFRPGAKIAQLSVAACNILI